MNENDPTKIAPEKPVPRQEQDKEVLGLRLRDEKHGFRRHEDFQGKSISLVKHERLKEEERLEEIRRKQSKKKADDEWDGFIQGLTVDVQRVFKSKTPAQFFHRVGNLFQFSNGAEGDFKRSKLKAAEIPEFPYTIIIQVCTLRDAVDTIKSGFMTDKIDPYIKLTLHPRAQIAGTGRWVRGKPKPKVDEKEEEPSTPEDSNAQKEPVSGKSPQDGPEASKAEQESLKGTEQPGQDNAVAAKSEDDNKESKAPKGLGRAMSLKRGASSRKAVKEEVKDDSQGSNVYKTKTFENTGGNVDFEKEVFQFKIESQVDKDKYGFLEVQLYDGNNFFSSDKLLAQSYLHLYDADLYCEDHFLRESEPIEEIKEITVADFINPENVNEPAGYAELKIGFKRNNDFGRIMISTATIESKPTQAGQSSVDMLGGSSSDKIGSASGEQVDRVASSSSGQVQRTLSSASEQAARATSASGGGDRPLSSGSLNSEGRAVTSVRMSKAEEEMWSKVRESQAQDAELGPILVQLNKLYESGADPSQDPVLSKYRIYNGVLYTAAETDYHGPKVIDPTELTDEEQRAKWEEQRLVSARMQLLAAASRVSSKSP